MYDIDAPRTRDTIAQDLRKLGVREGDTLLVHASLSTLGWVCGGAVAAVQALMDALGKEGTLMVPTHVTFHSDPSEWCNPPVPKAWWPIIRDSRPAYDPILSAPYKMGAIADTARLLPGALRSRHPHVSFAAIGPRAADLVGDHSFDNPLGEGSPLARLIDAEGRVLLLGVGFDRNTSFHLAEHRWGGAAKTESGSAIMENGVRVWKTWQDIDLDEDDFPVIGRAFETVGAVISGEVGSATARLFEARDAVEFATGWMGANRVRQV